MVVAPASALRNFLLLLLLGFVLFCCFNYASFVGHCFADGATWNDDQRLNSLPFFGLVLVKCDFNNLKRKKPRLYYVSVVRAGVHINNSRSRRFPTRISIPATGYSIKTLWHLFCLSPRYVGRIRRFNFARPECSSKHVFQLKCQHSGTGPGSPQFISAGKTAFIASRMGTPVRISLRGDSRKHATFRCN